MNKPNNNGFISWHCPHCGRFHDKIEVPMDFGERIEKCTNTECVKTYLVKYSFHPSVWVGKIEWEHDDE